MVDVLPRIATRNAERRAGKVEQSEPLPVLRRVYPPTHRAPLRVALSVRLPSDGLSIVPIGFENFDRVGHWFLRSPQGCTGPSGKAPDFTKLNYPMHSTCDQTTRVASDIYPHGCGPLSLPSLCVFVEQSNRYETQSKIVKIWLGCFQDMPELLGCLRHPRDVREHRSDLLGRL